METLPLERLGWDTSMRAFETDKDTRNLSFLTLPLSHSIPFIRAPGKTHYHLVINMPAPKSSSASKSGSANAQSGATDSVSDTETFVLHKSLSLRRGEHVVGRATRVWKAWLWDDMQKPEAERAVRCG